MLMVIMSAHTIWGWRLAESSDDACPNICALCNDESFWGWTTLLLNPPVIGSYTSKSTLLNACWCWSIDLTASRYFVAASLRRLESWQSSWNWECNSSNWSSTCSDVEYPDFTWIMCGRRFMAFLNPFQLMIPNFCFRFKVRLRLQISHDQTGRCCIGLSKLVLTLGCAKDS